MIGSMRDVIVAAQLEDAHDARPMPATSRRTIAARTRVRRGHPGHLPAVRVPGGGPRRAGRVGPDVGVGAQNVHHELQGAYTGEISAPMLVGLAELGHRRPLGAAARRGRDRRAHRPQARPGGRRGPAPDPVRRRAARGARGREPGRRRPSPARRAPSPDTTRRPCWRGGTGHRLRAGLGDRHRPERERPRRRRDGRRPSATRWPGSAGRCRRRRPGPVRRQRHVGQHRRVPGRALDRRRARRRRVAQARRDGRDRGTGRPDRRAPAARPRDRTPVATAPARRSSSSSSTGSGSGRDPAADAIAAAPMPTWRGLLRDWPHATLRASEDAVGLPAGQMGNSEVGHLNLGAGRPVLQDLPRIDAAIADGSFFERPALLEACARARDGRRATSTSSASSGRAASTPTTGTSSRWSSWRPRQGVPAVRVHALLDGRDTPPRSALGVRRRPRDAARRGAPGRRGSRRSAAATTRWTATGAGSGSSAATTPSSTGWGSTPRAPTAAIEAAYARGETDEFVAPTVIDGVDGTVRSGDPIVHANFRADRARQLTHALADRDVRRLRSGVAGRPRRRRPTCSS